MRNPSGYRNPVETPGGHNNYNNNNDNFNRAPPRAPNNSNTAPRWEQRYPITPKDKSTYNCYECGVAGHFSYECPKKLAKTAGNTSGPAQQQRHVTTNKFPQQPEQPQRRLYHMNAKKLRKPQTLCLPNRAERAVGCDAPWTRRSVERSSSLLLALHLYATLSSTPALYTLDTSPCLPCTVPSSH
ncbi:hypothetical protein QYE76_005137 [Lolium multiflorum]|uniref:CCHC-type domain-containing protein n=1 Tax=Lolium multiflorum TaxID=4521 RepID=A0AAD8RUB9_LOLMU|nr:hypothetical protein QYE76_005137 [Lolium multiflorum]